MSYSSKGGGTEKEYKAALAIPSAVILFSLWTNLKQIEVKDLLNMQMSWRKFDGDLNGLILEKRDKTFGV